MQASKHLYLFGSIWQCFKLVKEYPSLLLFTTEQIYIILPPNYPQQPFNHYAYETKRLQVG